MTEEGWDQRSNKNVDSANTNKNTGSTDPDRPDNKYEHFTILEQLCTRNSEYFKDDLSEKGQRLYEAFNGIIGHLRNARKLVEKVQGFAHEYDFDENTPGNGFRSFITVAEACISHTTNLARYVETNYNRVLFRKGHYMKEIEACNHFLASICNCFQYLLVLREWCPSGNLFCDGTQTVDDLLQMGDTINQYCFYGRCLGIQYSSSIRGVLRFISTCMAGFSESYYSQANRVAKTTSSVWTGGKYFLNPEQRARRIVNISKYAGIDFCKAFWFLAESEIMYRLPNIVSCAVKVNKIISIPPEELELENLTTGEPVKIPAPSSHSGLDAVNVRILSASVRAGIVGEYGNARNARPPSKNLIVHVHGGGFVAQSSKSHEVYLRDWTLALDTPIFSIDYSLAPQSPFPRALEEVFYSYCWAVKNCRCLGSTGERIIIAGDSAGANLSIACILKSIEYGIRRPDGLFMSYCPVLVNFVLSPARMLSLMDPLLPFGFMIRCLKAYACPSAAVLKENQKRCEGLEQVKNARDSITLHTLDNSARSSRKDSKATTASVENGFWESISNENGIITSPSDNTSDTFASASYHSPTVENTELLTPGDASSCLSFEDDSQPITKMPEADVKTMNGISNNAINLEALSRDEKDNYVSNFLKNYIIETPSEAAKTNGSPTIRPSVSKTESEEEILADAFKDMIPSESIQMRLNKAAGGIVDAISSKLSEFTNSSEIAGTSRDNHEEKINKIDALICRSPSLEFVFQVPRDPYMSPLWANEDILAQMPPTSVLSMDMDPCLDDCVMFAKKLKSLGVPVTIDILKGLPHGFLSFTKVSNEALKGSRVCIRRLAGLLNRDVT